MLRRALARAPSAAALAPARRRPPTLVPARTRFSIDIDERTPAEFAMARLNRKMQRAGVMRKLRVDSRGFVKKSKKKYDDRLKRSYKLSYRKVQNVLTWIELERMLSAQRRRATRAEARAARDDVEDELDDVRDA
mmetsp:Transcript_10920/g.32594  ORF Transcript_10920/g.32594 Transcript_10920/m.32594 type:complete len:135 (+) Transcript_10920:229-633(+)